ncbi:CD97 antigen isoform X1, partial [Clarias magur]
MSCWYLLFWGLLLAVLKEPTAIESCDIGYIIENGECVDDNECEYEDPICGANAVCYNTYGSYYCQCVTRYRSTSRTVNFTQENGGKCKDINECKESKSICGSNAECSNTPGSYYCTCDPGFVASNRQEQFNASQSVTCN